MTFNTVSEDHWYEESLRKEGNKGWISGLEDLTLRLVPRENKETSILRERSRTIIEDDSSL